MARRGRPVQRRPNVCSTDTDRRAISAQPHNAPDPPSLAGLSGAQPPRAWACRTPASIREGEFFWGWRPDARAIGGVPWREARCWWGRRREAGSLAQVSSGPLSCPPRHAARGCTGFGRFSPPPDAWTVRTAGQAIAGVYVAMCGDVAVRWAVCEHVSGVKFECLVRSATPASRWVSWLSWSGARQP